MSWTDEEIDKFAQEAAGSSSFEYKDEYWKEMEAMLPSVSGKKDFLWFFTAVVFVGLIGISAFHNPLTELNTTTIKSQVNTKEIYNQTEQSPESKAEKHVSANNDLKDKQEEEVSAYSPQQQNKSVTSSTNQHTKAVAAQSGLSNNPIVKDVDRSSSFKNNVAVSPLKQGMSETARVEQLGQGAINQLPILGLSTQVWYPELASSQLHSERNFPVKATLYLGGFAGLSQSLVTPSDKLSSSFGIGAGTQIQKGKLLLTAGINGIWSNHQDLVLNRRAKVYSFGSSEYNYDFDYKEIYSLEAEISVGYKLGKHTVNIGARPSYVVGTKVGISSSVNEQQGERKTYYGNMDGINRFGVKPFVGYAFDLSPSLKLGMNLGVQLMPMVQEGYLVGSNNALPIDGQLYIRKSLRFKR